MGENIENLYKLLQAGFWWWVPAYHYLHSIIAKPYQSQVIPDNSWYGFFLSTSGWQGTIGADMFFLNFFKKSLANALNFSLLYCWTQVVPLLPEGFNLRLQWWGPSGLVLCFLGREKKFWRKKNMAEKNVWQKIFFGKQIFLAVGRWQFACGRL